ncbi:MAG TPA: M48 family metallopeptidase [Candidatus Pacearchaeota archaeon]|nr:M48 family metallopeptidase [Candidatus Pacearchaeota archaeon]HPM08391.1 M48 family metallopeptidase [Candidatus Pacearchaeota archaeon]
MATLYTQIDSNNRKTWLLMALFSLVVISVGWAISYYYGNNAFLFFATGLAIFQTFFSYWYSDKIIMASFAATPIKKDDNPELYRIVENLAITAGLPMPKVYIINTQQINAFATGRDEKNAAIAVTTGLLEKLEKPEIEGVISHEMAHIGNKDILLQTVIVGLIGVISIIGEMFFRGGFNNDRDNDRNNSPLAIVAIIFIVLSPLIGRLIQFSVSRKREFLADSTGALLTRYPEGLARALEKISEDKVEFKKANTGTEHLFIANPFRGEKIANFFSTHPPIEERIKALRNLENK